MMAGSAKDYRERKVDPDFILDAELPLKRRPKPRTWEDSFRALVPYKEQHGDCDVPSNYSEGRGLGQ
jgi:hypothetical protein